MPRVAAEVQSFDARRRPQPEEGSLDVLYHDEAILVVHKPAGLVVHPTYKNTSGTLLNVVLWRFRAHPEVRPGILTRLDKDTSGLVIVALTPGVHAAMQKDMTAGRTLKQYLAILGAVPEPRAGTIVLPLARDPGDRRRVIVTASGAACETRYEVLGSRDAHAMVRCEPVTGRTHQIRVHMAASGWPIVGDRVYGTASELIARQALHAWRVSMPHPTSRERITFEAPIPADIARLACGL